MFQQHVNRQYTVGFLGEIVRDGTVRARPGRITSATIGVNGSTNRVSRVFGYAGETGTPIPQVAGAPINAGMVAEVAQVEVGGANFFGILGHPKHYTTQGTSAGALSPTLDLPIGTEGEFINSTAGMVVEIINMGTAAQNVTFGNKLAYITAATTAAQNPLLLPLGAIVAYSGALPAGLTAIPNAFVVTELTLGASAAGALMATPVIIQMAN